MRIYRNPKTRIDVPSAVVTVGSFDGVHIGHRAIIERLCAVARSIGGTAALVTLYPHPRKVLGAEADGFGLLSSLEEKEALLERAGVEALVEVEFTPRLGMMSSEEFAREILHDIVGARHVIVGYDHRFGHGRKGDFGSLSESGRELGFEVTQMSRQDACGRGVSSTAVRDAVRLGDMQRAALYLGHPYIFIGRVKDGILCVEESMKLMPPEGDYRAGCDGREITVRVTADRKIVCPEVADGKVEIGLLERLGPAGDRIRRGL